MRHHIRLERRVVTPTNRTLRRPRHDRSAPRGRPGDVQSNAELSPTPGPNDRRRVTQEDIDRMAALRRQGISQKEIGRRLGFSERTVRRYVGNVETELRVPQPGEEPEFVPAGIRKALLKKFVGDLFHDDSLRQLTLTWIQVGRDQWDPIYGGPPSTRLMREAERLLRDVLQRTGDETLKFVAIDPATQRRFVRDVIGDLLSDYERWLYVKQMMGTGDNETGEDWRPLHERPAHETKEVNDLWRRRGEFGL